MLLVPLAPRITKPERYVKRPSPDSGEGLKFSPSDRWLKGRRPLSVGDVQALSRAVVRAFGTGKATRTSSWEEVDMGADMGPKGSCWVGEVRLSGTC